MLQFAQSPEIDMASYFLSEPDYGIVHPQGEFNPASSPLLLHFPPKPLDIPQPTAPSLHNAHTPGAEQTEDARMLKPDVLAALGPRTRSSRGPLPGAPNTTLVQVPQAAFQTTPKKPTMHNMGTQTFSNIATQTSPSLAKSGPSRCPTKPATAHAPPARTQNKATSSAPKKQTSEGAQNKTQRNRDPSVSDLAKRKKRLRNKK